MLANSSLVNQQEEDPIEKVHEKSAQDFETGLERLEMTEVLRAID